MGATRVATGRLSHRTIVYMPPRHTSGKLRSKVISASFLQIARKNRQMMTLTTSGVNHQFVTYSNDNAERSRGRAAVFTASDTPMVRRF